MMMGQRSASSIRALIAALVAIPLLVAAVCLGAFWSPGDHTQGLRVALVNQDDGYKANGTETNAGDDLVRQITGDDQMRWTITDDVDAERGVKDGSYAFSVTIPADFSQRVARSSSLDAIAASVAATGDDTSESLKAASITIEYNDANNAQARELGGKVMETIRKALSQSTGQTTASTLLVTVSQLDQGLSSAADGAKALGDGADALGKGTEQLGQGLGQLSTGASALAQGTSALATGLDQLNAGMPTLAQGLGQLSAGASAVAGGNQALAGQMNDLASQANGYRDQALAAIDQVVAQHCAPAQTPSQASQQERSWTDQGAAGTAEDATAGGTGHGDANAASGAHTQNSTESHPAAAEVTSQNTQTDASASGTGDGAQLDGPAQGAETAAPGQTGTGSTATGSQSGGATATPSASAGVDASSLSQACSALAQVRAQIAQIPDLTQVEQISQINQLAQGSQAVADGLAALNSQSQTLTTGISQLAQGSRTIDSGAQALAQGVNAAGAGTDALTKGAGQLTDGIGRLGDGLRQGADVVPTLSIGGAGGAEGSGSAQGPGATAASDGGATSGSAGSGTSAVADTAPASGDASAGADSSSSSNTAGGSSTSAAMSALDALNALRNTTAVMIDPVQTTADVSNEAGTLGMAIAPWTMVFALALGAVLSWMALDAVPRRALASRVPGWRAVMGAAAPALLIAVAQTLTMLAVLVWAMGAKVARPWGLVPFALLVAVALMALQHLLVLAWGRGVGTMASLVLYAVGFVGGGGLLPVSVTPMPLRVIGPLLPTTYAIDGLRVTITGGTSGSLAIAVAVLASVTVGCLIGSSLIVRHLKVWTVSRLHA